MPKLKSNIIDFNHKNANMYGCQPCPKCKSRNRTSYKRPLWYGDEVVRIECDDCGHKEWADEDSVKLEGLI